MWSSQARFTSLVTIYGVILIAILPLSAITVHTVFTLLYNHVISSNIQSMTPVKIGLGLSTFHVFVHVFFSLKEEPRETYTDADISEQMLL